jgi:CPA1 family monovalent cation:H+ antiporter
MPIEITHYSFLNITVFVLLVAVAAQLLQEKIKFPASISAVIAGLTMKALGFTSVIGSDYAFDQITLILLPILLTLDVLHLHWSYIKKHALSLFYAAGISVIIAIGIGVLISHYMLPGYELSLAAVTMLMCMVTATDPCSVSAIFSTQKVPKDLKVLAEGESCFNDATVLVIFSLALFVENAAEPVSVASMSAKAFMVIFGAIFIGGIIGGVGLLLMKLTRNALTETLILLTTAFVSFAITEHFHFSGILAIIVSVMLTNTVILKRIKDDEVALENDSKNIRAFIDKKNHESLQQFIQFLGVISVTIMFLSLADVVMFDTLLKYWKEILSVFVASTVIRAVVLAKFGLVSNAIGRMQNISISWYKVLVFGGVKGCLSLIMLHFIPDTATYKQTFEAIVVGVILLTTFIYPIFLIGTLRWYGDNIDIKSKSVGTS